MGNMVSPKQMGESEFGKATADFLNLAYSDCLAARVLLNADLPIQGAILASTAVEKYFKALLAFRGNESHGHLRKAHVNAATNFDARLAKLLNRDFLELLKRAYLLRYRDKLAKDFNLVIASREFLAELDYTCVMMQESFRLKVNGQQVALQHHTDRERKDPRLWENNCALKEKIRRQDFISAQPQLVYEYEIVGYAACSTSPILLRLARVTENSCGSAYEPVDQFGIQYRTAFKNPEQPPAVSKDIRSGIQG